MIGKILGNRYEIVEKIGEGGMGLVYKAKCHLLNRYVAVKMLKPEFTGDEEFINKFKKESLSSASLSHPNIVNIYDVGVEDGIYYIVMEYVKGKTLKEIIRERAPLQYFEIINICRQICLALEHAHNNNIIHRDIKPQNILITHDGIVKVADFGIARASSSATLTNTGNVIGSVYYISPEQARGGYTDEKTDIYSLGTVMYEMAVSKVPFIADSPVAIALKHIQENVARPSEMNPDIPVALEDIILKSLEKNPAQRYESAAAMIKDLDKASASPNVHLYAKNDGINDITRVMPAIKDSYLKETSNSKQSQKRKRINKFWLAFIIFMVGAAMVTGLFIYMSGLQPKDVPVPSIIGMDENQAQKALKSFGLEMDVAGRIYRSDIPKGTVISTVPDVGIAVKPGSTVKVKVSAGPEQVNVPKFVGTTLTDTQLKLEQLGLKGDILEIYDAVAEKGYVVRQEPDVNTQVPKGSTVKIYASKGPETKGVVMPGLVDVTLDKAEEMLTAAKLKWNIKYKYDPTKPLNVVLEQNVEKGVQVVEGETVDIVVNNNAPFVPATP